MNGETKVPILRTNAYFFLIEFRLIKNIVECLVGSITQNYIIMMFDQPYTAGNALPPIKKQVTTDNNGLAYFDLKTMITCTTSTTYYFKAFLSNGVGS